MERIKGHVVEILSADTLLVEVDFVGRFNGKTLPDVVRGRFTELSPPYTKGVTAGECEVVLNKRLLGQFVSANVGPLDLDGVFSGKVSCEGPYCRNKKKFV